MEIKVFKSKRVRIAVIAAAVIAMVWFVTGGVSSIVQLYRLHTEVNTMAADLRRVNTTIDSLHLEIQRLKTDTTYIEQIARERLGMAKKNEHIYKFVQGKDTADR